MGRTLLILFSVGLAAGAAAPAADAALGPLAPETRISTTGAEGDPNREVFSAGMAHNSTSGDYLVGWDADALATDDEFEAFGQLLTSAGAEVGGDLRISSAGTDGDANREAVFPQFAYNPAANEYMAVWIGDGLATDEEFEIFGQRIGADGAEIGGDFRISNVGADGDAARRAGDEAIAYNSVANEYLVVWEGDGLATNDEQEVFGQRLSATGAEIGGDFRISNVGTDGVAARDADRPVVAYNSTDNEYLVVFVGDGLATDNEIEVFGQRLSATGAEIGGDFRISTVGQDADATRDAERPAIAFNGASNEYLAVWAGDGLATDEDVEIFAQRVAANGTEVGADFRVSETGPEGALREANGPEVASQEAAGEYLVVWSGDGLATAGEEEVFGQRLSAGGTELQPEFRISRTGTDGDAARSGQFPAVAHNPVADEYMVSWEADGLVVDDDFEMFSTRVGELPAPPAPPAPTAGSAGESFDLRAAIKRCKKKFPKGSTKRKRCIRKARNRAAG